MATGAKSRSRLKSASIRYPRRSSLSGIASLENLGIGSSFASAIPGSKSQLIWTKRSTITTHGGTSVVSSQSSFAKRVAQLLLGRFNFAGCFLAKQDGAEFFSLIIACDESFLRVDPGKIDPSWLGTKVADKIHVQVKHLRPKVRNLLVADPFFAGHIRAGDQPLVPRVVPMRLPPYAAHHAVWIKCEVADCVDSFFLCLEIVREPSARFSINISIQ